MLAGRQGRADGQCRTALAPGAGARPQIDGAGPPRAGAMNAWHVERNRTFGKTPGAALAASEALQRRPLAQCCPEEELLH